MMLDPAQVAPLLWTQVAIWLIAMAGADMFCLAARIRPRDLKTICMKLLAAGVCREMESESLLLRLQTLYVHHPRLFFSSGDFSPLRNVRFLEAEALKFDGGDYAKPQHGRKGTRS